MSEELETFINRDDKIKQQLDRKTRVYNMLQTNRNNLEMSLNQLNNVLNRSGGIQK